MYLNNENNTQYKASPQALAIIACKELPAIHGDREFCVIDKSVPHSCIYSNIQLK